MAGAPTLDVAVQLLVRMQVVQAQKQLANDDGDVVLANEARFHEVRAATARAKLHNNPQLRTLGVRAIVLCNIGGLQLRQDGNLLDNVLDLVLGALDVDNLDGNRLAGSLVDTGGQVSNWSEWLPGE
jgi:hypothetical protein